LVTTTRSPWTASSSAASMSSPATGASTLTAIVRPPSPERNPRRTPQSRGDGELHGFGGYGELRGAATSDLDELRGGSGGFHGDPPEWPQRRRARLRE
jgi:hypothetical protein